ncbi:MAG: FAD-dependent oxidoreductase, partial [Candidatus Eisenbacteria bacterium]
MRLGRDEPFPREIDLVVIGGGPGGASAGLAAARLGLRVLLLEQTRFPRHKLGETLPPKVLPILSFLGVLPEVEAAGFVRMNGNTNLLGATPVAQVFAPGGHAYGFQVERDRFDEILLAAAEREGVCVAEEASVSRPLLARDNSRHVTGVVVRRPGRGAEALLAPFVIDASGPSCLLARA